MQFTDEEVETLKTILSDHGSDCPSADYAKVQALGVKLGVWEEVKPPTEEELKRIEDYRNSPAGKMLSEIFKRNNETIAKMVADEMHDQLFYQGVDWGKSDAPIGSVLKIKLPDDFTK